MADTSPNLPVPDTGVPDAATHLPAIIAALAAPRQEIEAAFLGVGQELGDAATLLDRIVATFEALPRDLDGAEMQEAGARLGRFTGHAHEIAAAFARERGDVQKLLAAVSAATHPVEDLHRSVRLMGILSVNARIVAAGLTDAADQFDVFTTDIAELSKSATAAVAAFAEGHLRLAGAVRRAADQFTGFEAAHRERLEGLAASLDQGLAAVAERQRLSAERSAETARVSQEMAMRIASAVMALQVGDSTRQRVQHSEEALTHLAGWLAGATPHALGVAAEDRPALAAIVISLQQAQLHGTIEAFDHETREAEHALVELAADASVAITECRRLYDDKIGGTPIALLGTQMREAALLLRDCAGEREQLDALATAVGDMVEVLLGHVEAVRDIEANMRLVGLNAAVKCAQLGPRGAALSVIAAQLRELTGELVPAARAAVTQLGEAVSIARAFTAGSTGRLAAEVGELEAEATTALGLLEAVERRLGAALATLDRDGAEAETLLATASHGLSRHASLAEALADAEFDLARIAPAAAEEAMPALADVLRALRRGYSMEAERRIHDDFAAALGVVAEPPADTTDSAATDEDDVLLF
jgi:hypothetical protein